MSHTTGIVFLGCSRISALWGWAGAQGTASRAPVDCGCPTARTPYHEHAPPCARRTTSTPYPEHAVPRARRTTSTPYHEHAPLPARPTTSTPHRAHALPRARPTARTPYHEHAEGPPVRTLRVAPPVHHLRRHVLDRPAEGVGSLVVVDGLFTQPEIYRDTPHTALSLWAVFRPLAARPALPASLPGPRGPQRLSQAPRLPVGFCRDEHVRECSRGYPAPVF